MLARILVYLKKVHPKTPIPVPIPALEGAVKCFKPGLQDGSAEVLRRLFREAILNRKAPFEERREIFQLLVDLARKEHALAIGILKPFIRIGLTIRETMKYDLPELIGLLDEAGANIRERNDNGYDLLEIAIANNLSLPMIEAVLEAFAAANVSWREGVCLQYAMRNDLVPLAGLLLEYGARWPTIHVETWFCEHPD